MSKSHEHPASIIPSRDSILADGTRNLNPGAVVEAMAWGRDNARLCTGDKIRERLAMRGMLEHMVRRLEPKESFEEAIHTILDDVIALHGAATSNCRSATIWSSSRNADFPKPSCRRSGA